MVSRVAVDMIWFYFELKYFHHKLYLVIPLVASLNTAGETLRNILDWFLPLAPYPPLSLKSEKVKVVTKRHLGETLQSESTPTRTMGQSFGG